MTTELIPKKYTSGEKPSGDFSRWGLKPPITLLHTLVLSLLCCKWQSVGIYTKTQAAGRRIRLTGRNIILRSDSLRKILTYLEWYPSISFEVHPSMGIFRAHRRIFIILRCLILRHQTYTTIICLANTHGQPNNPLVWPLQTSGSIHVR